MGVKFETRDYIGNDPAGFVVSLNLHRRHLTESQRAAVAAKLASLPVGSNQHAQICAPSQEQAAEMLNVSRRSVQAAAKVLHQGAASLIEAVEQGQISVSLAAQAADLTAPEQIEMMATTPSDLARVAKKKRGAAPHVGDQPKNSNAMTREFVLILADHRMRRKHEESTLRTCPSAADGHHRGRSCAGQGSPTKLY